MAVNPAPADADIFEGVELLRNLLDRVVQGPRQNSQPCWMKGSFPGQSWLHPVSLGALLLGAGQSRSSPEAGKLRNESTIGSDCPIHAGGS